MDLRDSIREVTQALDRLADRNALQASTAALEGLDVELSAPGHSADELASVRYRLAAAALELDQVALPRIRELVARALAVAGKEAVRVACSPIELRDTHRDGRPMAPRVQYSLPRGY